MGLRLKFNLVLLLVFVLGLLVSGYVSYQLLHKNAREEVLRTAGVMMEAALAMRSYTVAQVRPGLRAQDRSSSRRACPPTRPPKSWRPAPEIPELRIQGSRAQPDQPARPCRRLGIGHHHRLPEQPGSQRVLRHPQHARRPVDVPGAATADQGPQLPGLPHHSRQRTAVDGQALRLQQRLWLEAQRNHWRADRVGADVVADRKGQQRLLYLHGVAGRRFRACCSSSST